MKNKFKTYLFKITLICLFSIAQLVHGQTKFNQYYTSGAISTQSTPQTSLGVNNDFTISPLTQEIYYIGGTSLNVYDPYFQSKYATIGKLSASGQPLWLKQFKLQSGAECSLNKIIYTHDNYLLSVLGLFSKEGHESGMTTYDGQVGFVKFDLNGVITNAQHYPDVFATNTPYVNNTEGSSLIEAQDLSGNYSYATAGRIRKILQNSDYYTRILVLKSQTNLSLSWKKYYTFFPNELNHTEYANCIYQAADKNYIVTGKSDDCLFIMKIDQSNGSVIWAHRYTFDESSEGASIIEDCNGNIIVSGNKNRNILLMSLTQGGTLNWSEILDEGEGRHLMKASNSNELCLGGTLGPGSQYWVFKMNFSTKSCNNNTSNVYGNYQRYYIDQTICPSFHFKMMKEKPSGGYMYLLDFPTNTSDVFRCNFVSTDNLFYSTRGIANKSAYCLPQTTPVNSSIITPTVSSGTDLENNTFEEPITFQTDPLTVESKVNCENCPDPNLTELLLEYCTIDNNNGLWHQPYQTLNGNERYVLKNSSTGYYYDSKIGYNANGQHISGAIAHFLTAGTYTLEFYDTDGCLLEIRTITVSPKDPTVFNTPIHIPVHFCKAPGNTGKWVNPCDYITMPADFRYTSKDLHNPPRGPVFNSDDWVSLHGGNGCIAMLMEEGSYEVELFDKTNCQIKKYIFDIIPDQATLVYSIAYPISYCSTPGKTGTWVEPCKVYKSLFGDLPTNFAYTLTNNQNTSGIPNFNSADYVKNNGGDGCIALFLENGNTTLDFYDITNCEYKRITLSVTGNAPTLTSNYTVTIPYCSLQGNTGAWVNPCDVYKGLFNLSTITNKFMYTAYDNQTPPRGPVFNSDQWVDAGNPDPCIALLMESGSYSIDFYNIDNCEYVHITVNIQDIKQDVFLQNPLNYSYCPDENSVKINICDLIKNKFILLPQTFPVDYTYDVYNNNNPALSIFNSDQYAAQNGGNKCPFIDFAAGTYSVTFTDRTNCKIYHVIIIVTIMSDCKHTPGYIRQENNGVSNPTENPNQKSQSEVTNVSVQTSITGHLTKINVYPNPNNGQFTVRIDAGNSDETNEYTIQVQDINGKIISTLNKLLTNTDNQIDISHLSEGVYILKITYQDKTTYVKLIKK